MDMKFPARIAAIAIAAVVLGMTMFEMTRKKVPEHIVPAPATQPAPDPLRADLQRCQRMGEAAANDAHCLRIWAETRDRFLGRPSAIPRNSKE